MAQVIIDAGPLVAFLDNRDAHHEWVVRTTESLRPPFEACEAVLTEAMFLLRGEHAAREALFGMLREGVLRATFRLDAEAPQVAKLMAKYSDVPMSLADACLVRLSETTPRSVVLTLDRDFSIYRRSGNRRIDVIAPWV